MNAFTFLVTSAAGNKFEVTLYDKDVAKAIVRLNDMTDRAPFVRL